MIHNCRSPRGLYIGDRWHCPECQKWWVADEDGSTRINGDGSVWRK